MPRLRGDENCAEIRFDEGPLLGFCIVANNLSPRQRKRCPSFSSIKSTAVGIASVP